jgi:hypothetical protein
MSVTGFAHSSCPVLVLTLPGVHVFSQFRLPSSWLSHCDVFLWLVTGADFHLKGEKMGKLITEVDLAERRLLLGVCMAVRFLSWVQLKLWDIG